MKRPPVVAGQFYPGTEKGLRREIERCIDRTAVKRNALGVVSPHAGYVYSGKVAGALFSSVHVPPVAVIMGPNHRGVGSEYAVMTGGSWVTPLGEVPVAADLARELCETSELFDVDASAHAYEHSIEVQLPFLQYVRSDVRIVPLCMGGLNPDDFFAVGHAIARCLKRRREPALIVASSDLTHYEGQETAKEKDRMVIEAVLNLDGKRMLDLIREHDISMCGYAPTVAMIAAARDCGATDAELVRYMTSGDTSGDYAQVVGYAGIMVYKK
jgi:AmmeMemoRadiSam system protein B